MANYSDPAPPAPSAAIAQSAAAADFANACPMRANDDTDGALRHDRHSVDLAPPALPPDSVYTSCYCEENVYLLAQAFVARDATDATATATAARLGPVWDPFVVFISNQGKSVALWNQKAREDVVVWDYHVVLVLRPAPHDADDSSSTAGALAWVYDLDTRLPVPCAGPEYVAGTFPYAHDAALASLLGEAFQSRFRVVPAAAFLAWFASDRSHMLAPARAGSTAGPLQYSAPPPAYPPLCGPRARERGVVHNLAAFVSMAGAGEFEESAGGAGGEGRYGAVMDVPGFVRWLRRGGAGCSDEC